MDEHPLPRPRAEKRTRPLLRGLEPFDFDPEADPVATLLGRLAPSSRVTVRSALRVLAGIASGGEIPPERFPWHRLRYADAQAFRRECAARYEPAGANGKLTALRQVAHECFLHRLMEADDADRVKAIRNIPESGVLRGREVTLNELAALAAQCRADPRPQGVRDAAIFAVLATVGPRRGEVSSLKLSDLDRDVREIAVRRKGARIERVPLAAGALAAIDRWIERRGRKPGPLFYRSDKHGTMVPLRLGSDAIGKMVGRRAKAAGLEPLTPHDFRRTVAGNLLDDERVDIGTAKGILGHRKTDTLLRYDRRPMRAAHAAIDRASGVEW